MLQNLVVIAAYDQRYIDTCLKSLGNKYPVVVMDTSEGGHPTGAYIRAYRQHPAKNYLFIQDTMQALVGDYLQPFVEKMPKLGVVGWCGFAFGFDSDEQRRWIEQYYSGEPPAKGIFGPVFYTSRASLKKLESMGLLPPSPSNKLEAQGTERMWAWAFHQAGLETRFVVDLWDKSVIERGDFPIFKKVFAGRV